MATEEDRIKAYQAEAEAGYDVADLKHRGRPRLGPAAYTVVVPVRVTQAVADALDQQAAAIGGTRSDVVRDLIDRTLIAA